MDCNTGLEEEPHAAVLRAIQDGRSLEHLQIARIRGRFDLRKMAFAGPDGAPLAVKGYTFSNCDLEGASFANCELRDVHFNESNLASADFRKGVLSCVTFARSAVNSADFRGARLTDVDFAGSSLVDVDFAGAVVIDVPFRECHLRGSSFTDTRVSGTCVGDRRTGIYRLEDELDGDWSGAAEVYRQLRDPLRQMGADEEAGQLFYRRRFCELRANRRAPAAPLSRMLYDFLSWSITGFGERPLRVVAASTVLIIGYAILYSWFGVYGYSTGSAPDGRQFRRISGFENVYFSMVTFATLGYGDVSPAPALVEERVRTWQLGDSRARVFRKVVLFTPASEALAGAGMVAMFIVTLARRVIRE